jgi:hypothetical protein
MDKAKAFGGTSLVQLVLGKGIGSGEGFIDEGDEVVVGTMAGTVVVSSCGGPILVAEDSCAIEDAAVSHLEGVPIEVIAMDGVLVGEVGVTEHLEVQIETGILATNVGPGIYIWVDCLGFVSLFQVVKLCELSDIALK